MSRSVRGTKRARRWFRAFAVLAGLLPFVILEVLLAAAGLGRPSLRDDPLAGFGPDATLFGRVDDRYELRAQRQRFFAPASFAARKAPETFRIFVLGGSTVQGRPWSTPTSFPTWLRLALDVAETTDRRWEVVNCGGISYASYRLARVLDEILGAPGYDADLIVLCTGHNEFLEERSYGRLRRLPGFAQRVVAWAADTRTVRVLNQLLGRGGSGPRATLPAEVATRLDREGGLDRYRADPGWRSGVLAHFESSVRRMAVACRDAGVPLLVIDPPARLAGCPPFKSAPWPSGGSTAAEHYARAVQLHDRGELSAARVAYVAAKDADVCPLRILSAQRDVLRELEAPLLDAHALLEADCESGILDGWRMADHVHPTIRGQQLIGIAIAEWLQGAGYVGATAGWRARIETRFTAQLDALPPGYHLRADRELEQLERWASGRVGAAYPHGR